MFVADDRGEALAVAWENAQLPPVLNIDGSLIESKLIKAIIPGFKNPDTSKEKDQNMVDLAEMNHNYQVEKLRKIKLSPKERAQSTALADILFTGVAGRKMTDEERDQVILAQEKFFEEHENWAEANPTCYWKLIERIPKDAHRSAARPINDVMRSVAISIVEKQVANGIIR